MMGGYGGVRGKAKGKCYYDTGNHKVTDKNAIAVAEKYIKEGTYVSFLQQKPPSQRPDLSVDGKLLVEVKGMTSTKPHKTETNIRDAFRQIMAEQANYPKDKRHPGKVVILSKHENFEEGYRAAREGYRLAKEHGFVHGKVEFWHNGHVYELE